MCATSNNAGIQSACDTFCENRRQFIDRGLLQAAIFLTAFQNGSEGFLNSEIS
jgi:hypothetical protein